MTLLKSMGCDQMQGYLFGKPAPMDRFSIIQGALKAKTLGAGTNVHPIGAESQTPNVPRSADRLALTGTR